jgi:hypothetical protein
VRKLEIAVQPTVGEPQGGGVVIDPLLVLSERTN